MVIYNNDLSVSFGKNDSLSESYNFELRELSLLQIEVNIHKIEEETLKESNQVVRMRLKFYESCLEKAERRITELEQENQRIRKRLRPNIFRRMIIRLQILIRN